MSDPHASSSSQRAIRSVRCEWSCVRCSFDNVPDVVKCVVCGSHRRDNARKLTTMDTIAMRSASPGLEFQVHTSPWSCNICTLVNSASAKFCSACEYPAPVPVSKHPKPLITLAHVERKTESSMPTAAVNAAAAAAAATTVVATPVIPPAVISPAVPAIERSFVASTEGEVLRPSESSTSNPNQVRQSTRAISLVQPLSISFPRRNHSHHHSAGSNIQLKTCPICDTPSFPIASRCGNHRCNYHFQKEEIETISDYIWSLPIHLPPVEAATAAGRFATECEFFLTQDVVEASELYRTPEVELYISTIKCDSCQLFLPLHHTYYHCLTCEQAQVDDVSKKWNSSDMCEFCYFSRTSLDKHELHHTWVEAITDEKIQSKGIDSDGTSPPPSPPPPPLSTVTPSAAHSTPPIAAPTEPSVEGSSNMEIDIQFEGQPASNSMTKQIPQPAPAAVSKPTTVGAPVVGRAAPISRPKSPNLLTDFDNWQQALRNSTLPVALSRGTVTSADKLNPPVAKEEHSTATVTPAPNVIVNISSILSQRQQRSNKRKFEFEYDDEEKQQSLTALTSTSETQAREDAAMTEVNPLSAGARHSPALGGRSVHTPVNVASNSSSSSSPASSSSSSSASIPRPAAEEHDDMCHICCDGGTITECDICVRAFHIRGCLAKVTNHSTMRALLNLRRSDPFNCTMAGLTCSKRTKTMNMDEFYATAVNRKGHRLHESFSVAAALRLAADDADVLNGLMSPDEADENNCAEGVVADDDDAASTCSDSSAFSVTPSIRCDAECSGCNRQFNIANFWYRCVTCNGYDDLPLQELVASSRSGTFFDLCKDCFRIQHSAIAAPLHQISHQFIRVSSIMAVRYYPTPKVKIEKKVQEPAKVTSTVEEGESTVATTPIRSDVITKSANPAPSIDLHPVVDQSADSSTAGELLSLPGGKKERRTELSVAKSRVETLEPAANATVNNALHTAALQSAFPPGQPLTPLPRLPESSSPHVLNPCDITIHSVTAERDALLVQRDTLQSTVRNLTASLNEMTHRLAEERERLEFSSKMANNNLAMLKAAHAHHEAMLKAAHAHHQAETVRMHAWHVSAANEAAAVAAHRTTEAVLEAKAAAAREATEAAASSAASSAAQSRELIAAHECVICMDAKRQVVFLPCQHMVCCASCAGPDASNNYWVNNCSQCQRHIKDRIVVNL